MTILGCDWETKEVVEVEKACDADLKENYPAIAGSWMVDEEFITFIIIPPLGLFGIDDLEFFDIVRGEEPDITFDPQMENRSFRLNKLTLTVVWEEDNILIEPCSIEGCYEVKIVNFNSPGSVILGMWEIQAEASA